MALLWSMVFGPTDSAAGTKTGLSPTTTLVGRQAPPSGGTIRTIRVGKGNVTDAKENAGVIEVEISGVNGPFQFAYGNGSGGASNTGVNMPAEKIDCAIPVPAGATMKVWVTDAEAAKDVIVSLEGYSEGGYMRSYACGGAGVDATADTQLTVGTVTPVIAGQIKQIRFAASGVVDAKAESGKLVASIPGQSGPFEFSVGSGPQGDSLGGLHAPADVIGDEKRPLNIPAVAGQAITVYLTAAEVVLSATASVMIG